MPRSRLKLITDIEREKGMFAKVINGLTRIKSMAFLSVFVLVLPVTPGYANHEKKDASDIDTFYLDNLYPKYPQTAAASGVKAKMIKKGEYLAKIGDCIACHTNVKEGGKPFAGGLPIDTPFGRFYSPNITPDKETGIGNWTEAEFVRSLHEGRGANGENLFPVYPYLYFAKVSERDARALYAYFMSIPAVKQENKKLGFPFNMPGARASLAGWKMLFFGGMDREPFRYNPTQSKEWNRGAYIVKGLGHCGMCHTPMNVFGAPKNEYFLTGTFVDGYWAPNISSEGLRSSSRLEVADVFKQSVLLNNAGPVAGPMAEVNHNSLSHLTDADRLAIATYLKTVVSRERVGVSEASKAEPSLQRGKQVYKKACIICHQDSKMGAPKIGNGNGWADRLNQTGFNALYRHTINGYNQMPLRGACVSCSDNDLISAVDYMVHQSLTPSQWATVRHGNPTKAISTGVEVYQENCSVCHADGKLGAPKVGDKQVWQPIIEKNLDVLMQNTIKSKKHPRNGGCKHCTTTEVIAAIKYMVTQGGDKGNYSLW